MLHYSMDEICFYLCIEVIEQLRSRAQYYEQRLLRHELGIVDTVYTGSFSVLSLATVEN